MTPKPETHGRDARATTLVAAPAAPRHDSHSRRDRPTFSENLLAGAKKETELSFGLFGCRRKQSLWCADKAIELRPGRRVSGKRRRSVRNIGPLDRRREVAGRLELEARSPAKRDAACAMRDGDRDRRGRRRFHDRC